MSACPLLAQVIDPHTHQYLDRLKDEPLFLALAQKVRACACGMHSSCGAAPGHACTLPITLSMLVQSLAVARYLCTCVVREIAAWDGTRATVLDLPHPELPV